MYSLHINIFNRLSSIYEKLGDEIRANAYHQLSKKLELGYTEGLTDKSVKKIEEINNTGKLKILEDLENNPEIKVRLKLSSIIGIGPKLAEKLYNSGVRNIKDVKKLKNLTSLQKLGIKYYNKIDYPGRKTFGKIINLLNKNIEEPLIIEPAGSYRSSKKIMSDIDLVICTKSGSIEPIIEILEKKGVLKDYVKSSQNDILGVIELNKKYYRIDIKVTIKKYLYSYMLYFGSGKYFSKYIRTVAKKMGYKLNRYGLEDLKTGKVKSFKSEKAIFKTLKMDYYTPEERFKYF